MPRTTLKPLALSGAFLVLAACAAPTPSVPVSESPPTAEAVWAVSATGSGESSDNAFQKVVTDADGNIYGVGSIYSDGTVTFGTVSASASGSGRHAFLVKFDPEGSALWVRTALSAPSNVLFNDVSTDSQGNVYASGSVYGSESYDFGTEETPVEVSGPAADRANALLVKYNASGVAQWARSATSASNESRFDGVAVYGSSVYAAGAIADRGTFQFGSGETLTSHADFDVLLVKYDASGTAQWARTAETVVSDNLFSSVATDSDGNVYAAGSIRGTGVFGFGNEVTATSAAPLENAVVVKYNASGEALWARTVVSGSSPSSFRDVALDGSGHVYAVGSLIGTDERGFGNGVSVSGSSESDSALLVQYNTAGTPRWARSGSPTPQEEPETTSTPYSVFSGVAVRGGLVFAAGEISPDPFDFDGVAVSGSGTNRNAVMVRYNAEGTVQWAQSTSSGSSGSSFAGLTGSGNGPLYAVGNVSGTEAYQFGSAVTTPGGTASSQALIVKYQ